MTGEISAVGDEVPDVKDVREIVVDTLDERSWRVIEAVMSTHLTLCIDNIESCPGLIIAGPSGAGKTTALRAFTRLPEQFYRTDEITPASFVSHDSSKSDEELEEDDLLPKIKHRTVLNLEMANWFSGDWETRSSRWAALTRVMDGDGYTRNTGTHGERGYSGDYRFSFIGATTPIDRKGWKVMAHAGNRFLIHEMPAGESEDAYRSILYGDDGPEYGEKVKTVRKTVMTFLRRKWPSVGGANAVSWTSSPDQEIASNIKYLSELIRYARAPPDNTLEAPHRVASMLQNLARGHALLCGRRELTMNDLNVCSRVALSTMPAKRRPLVREVVKLQVGEQLSAPEVMDQLEVSRPTAIKRMDLLDTLGIAGTFDETQQGGKTKALITEQEFMWPDNLPFPDW